MVKALFLSNCSEGEDTQSVAERGYMADIKFNTEAIENMYKEVGKAIDRLDEEVRAEFSGRPVDEIAAPIQKKFADAGVHLDIRGYASAVSKGEPFQFVVQ